MCGVSKVGCWEALFKGHGNMVEKGGWWKKGTSKGTSRVHSAFAPIMQEEDETGFAQLVQCKKNSMSYLLILGRKDRNFVISAEKTSLKPERLLLLILSSLCPYVPSMPFLPPFLLFAALLFRASEKISCCNFCVDLSAWASIFFLKVHLQTSSQMQQSQKSKGAFHTIRKKTSTSTFEREKGLGDLLLMRKCKFFFCTIRLFSLFLP